MKINICVNGTFRYPQYIRHYEDAGALNAFYFAHRPSTSGASLGLQSFCRNGWGKEVLLQAAFRAAPSRFLPGLATRVGDAWQADVIRHWRPCDTLEAVIGATADRIIAFAKGQGTRIIGHPVSAHPTVVNRLMARAYEGLGLDPVLAALPAMGRRLDEIADCDRLVADSPFVAQSFVSEGVSTERIATITPGLDVNRFHARTVSETDDGVFRVICVGLITPRKGQHILLQAWRMLNLPRAELVLVGLPGRDAAAVIRGSGDRFTHHRFVPNSALRALLVRGSVFVAPSVEDGFGQAPLEAMACGLPVIATETVGMSSLITEGQDGFVVPPFDPETIAARLEALYGDRPRAAAMGRAAAATVEKSQSWGGYVTRVLAEHRRLAGLVDPLAKEAA